LNKFFAILLIAVLLIAGCAKNPFGTRDAQRPAGSSGTWETPATPEAVLTNILYAYNEMNIQNYQLCLDDNFRFSATEDSIEAEAQGNGYLYHFWDKQVEVSTTENIFASLEEQHRNIFLTFRESTDYPDSIGDSLAVLYRDYTITTIAPDISAADTVAAGLVAFATSRTLFNWWSVYLWSEIPSTGDQQHWANYKAEHRP
jgi:hypothetical protein